MDIVQEGLQRQYLLCHQISFMSKVHKFDHEFLSGDSGVSREVMGTLFWR